MQTSSLTTRETSFVEQMNTVAMWVAMPSIRPAEVVARVSEAYECDHAGASVIIERAKEYMRTGAYEANLEARAVYLIRLEMLIDRCWSAIEREQKRSTVKVREASGGGGDDDAGTTGRKDRKVKDTSVSTSEAIFNASAGKLMLAAMKEFAIVSGVREQDVAKSLHIHNHNDTTASGAAGARRTAEMTNQSLLRLVGIEGEGAMEMIVDEPESILPDTAHRNGSQAVPPPQEGDGSNTEASDGA